jgi:hypothetical protein
MEHERRMDTVDQDIKKQEGWLKASAGFMTIAMIIVGSLCNVIITKLTTIEGMLGKTDVSIARHEERLSNVESDVKEIKARHTYLDQNGVIIQKNK